MSQESDFLALALRPGLLFEHDDGNSSALVFGFAPNTSVEMPEVFTHLRVVVDGSNAIVTKDRERVLLQGDFFFVVGPAWMNSPGWGMSNSAKGYAGLSLFGGPLAHQDTAPGMLARRWDEIPANQRRRSDFVCTCDTRIRYAAQCHLWMFRTPVALSDINGLPQIHARGPYRRSHS